MEHKSQKTIWNFFITQYRFTYLIVSVALLLGVIAIIQIPKESDPEVDIPFVVVNTSFPGSSAKDVEELVTDIIENKLIGVDGIKKFQSTSSEGHSSIFIEFDPKTSSQDQKDKIQEKVDSAKFELPEDAEDPDVSKIEISDDPIYIFSLSGPYDVIQLKKFAEKLKDDLEKISQVSGVFITGGQERVIKVIVNKASLDGYGLNIAQVTSAIRRANADIPIGVIETAGTDYTVRLAGRIFQAEEINKVPIAKVNNSLVLVEDVAQVIDGYAKVSSIARLSLDGSEPLSSVTINVQKTKGGNIIKVVDKVQIAIEEAQAGYLPDNIKTEEFFNVSEFIKNDLNDLVKNGIQTIVLIMILLYVFIGLREGIIASLAVPFSFLITFIFLNAFGYTINFLSLFSLILALGILIDTAIVIIERMNFYINSRQKTSTEAATITVAEFQWPLIAGTLTTVFAFVPMLLMSGIMGQYMKFIPITVTFVLLSSLFVGLAIIPALGARRLKNKAEQKIKLKGRSKRIRDFASSGLFTLLTNKYKEKLTSLIEHKKKRRALTWSIVALFILSLSLPVSGTLKMEMFPAEDFESVFIQIKKPLGSQLEETQKTIETIENYLLQDHNIKSFTVSIGRGIAFGGSGENFGEIVVNLKEVRDIESPQIIDNYQRYFDENIDDADVSIIQMSSGPPGSTPVDIGIKGDNLLELEKVTMQLRDVLKEIDGATDVKTTAEESKGEFVISIDRSKAQLYGISTIELAQILNNAVQGSKATTLRYLGEETEVIVKYALNTKSINGNDTNKISIEDLEALLIMTSQGSIPLSAFTNTKLAASKSFIRHENNKRSFRLSSQVESNITPLEVMSAFQKEVSALNLADDIELAYGGEQEELEQSYNDMFRAMILAIFLITAVLVLQFHSYRQPLFILSSIPLSFIGVFPGLMIVSSPITLPAIIGIVALAGIVVNNGIILVDRINKNRYKGMDKKQAVIEAGTVRLRPIILTTITTVVGILPITLSSQLWGGLGFTIIFGLTVSAFLTLFVVPLLYNRFAEKELDSPQH